MAAPIKKILPLALLLIVAVPIFFSVRFVVKQKLIQSQMKEKLELATLQTITFPLAGITWAKEGKEVIIEGKLFDVKSFTIANGQITLKGLFDGDEDRLFAEMKNSLQQKKDATNPLSQVKCIFLPLYTETISFSLENKWKAVACFFPAYAEPITALYYGSTAPPPKFS
jgi:hypothetical protein